MAYKLSEINYRAKTDPRGFIDECDADYHSRIRKAADLIAQNVSKSPIVLLSGPSGSGKTTTAKKLDNELTARGINTHSISMDDYFMSKNLYTMPLTEDGKPDYESPLCMNLELLNEHFTKLSKGERIYIPKFEFSRQMSVYDPSRTLKLKKDEVVIFEGIHALNDIITLPHPEAFKLYISARSVVTDDNDKTVFKGTWMRLVRRTIRDHLFRGSSAKNTMEMWATVRRGEIKYISPFKNKADLMFDSSFPYEVCVLNNLAKNLFASVPEGIGRYEEISSILPAFELFEDIDPSLLNPDSLLREFVGGGIYEY